MVSRVIARRSKMLVMIVRDKQMKYKVRGITHCIFLSYTPVIHVFPQILLLHALCLHLQD